MREDRAERRGSRRREVVLGVRERRGLVRRGGHDGRVVLAVQRGRGRRWGPERVHARVQERTGRGVGVGRADGRDGLHVGQRDGVVCRAEHMVCADAADGRGPLALGPA